MYMLPVALMYPIFFLVCVDAYEDPSLCVTVEYLNETNGMPLLPVLSYKRLTRCPLLGQRRCHSDFNNVLYCTDLQQ